MKISWWPANGRRLNRLARELAALREQVEAMRAQAQAGEEERRALQSRAERAEEALGSLREEADQLRETINRAADEGGNAREAAERRNQATDRELASLRAASDREERRHALHVEETGKQVTALAERIEQARLAMLRRG